MSIRLWLLEVTTRRVNIMNKKFQHATVDQSHLILSKSTLSDSLY